MKLFRQRYFELTFWLTALILLALMKPEVSSHFSFCLFKLAGIDFCPGCGLGHAISFLFHGNIRASLSAHPLGLFALAVILIRIYRLSILHIFSSSKNYHHAIR